MTHLKDHTKCSIVNCFFILSSYIAHYAICLKYKTICRVSQSNSQSSQCFK
jgi:hypothetical protein